MDDEAAPREVLARRSHPVWLGGAAAMMSVIITHPIDQTKVRSQTQHPRRGMLETARNTLRSSGALGLWTGLSGSLLRQATYGAARFGIYGKLKERDIKLRGGTEGSRWGLVKNGAIAGVFAGLVGAPADGVKKPEKRLGYRNAIDGLLRIAREEGLSSTFRGGGATMLRSVVMNATQLSCYDIIKEQLLLSGHFTDSVPTHLLTAVIGGTIAVTACAPIDVMKSRIQSNTKPSVSAMNIVSRSLRREGASVLFRGWLPAFLRMTPSTTLTFMFFEQLKRIF
ncbi:Mitochondrial dicarboxylate transporter [Saitozyma podzolica]|uniref:Mitochondrial dicarboxylate transporter n=1 Tax=Saitozyma podzolica TaxID=1890683 RepID=A0A427YH71_9TREE|nr:Mitochondrial dicarboxylate transporter [Saitozyma podzolica]